MALPMPPPSKRLAYLTRFINAKRTLQNTDAVAGADVVSRYQVFNLSGFDYKGQLSCAYGVAGGAVGVLAQFDLLQALAPLLPISTLSVGGEAQISGEKESLFALHRFPKAIYPARVIMASDHPTPIQSSKYPASALPLSPSWSTTNPLSLLCFDGLGGEVAFKLTLRAGDQLDFLRFMDEVNFELSLSAQATLELKGSFKRLYAPYPDYFPSPSDVNAAEAARLDMVIDSLLNQPGKTELKAEIEAWIESLVQEMLGPAGAPAEARSRRERAREKVWGFLGKAKAAGARAGLADATSSIESYINDYLLAPVGGELRLPAFHEWLKNWLETPSSAGLVARLRTLQKQILQSELESQAKRAYWQKARRYEMLLTRYYQRSTPAPAAAQAPRSPDYLSHFKMFSFCAGADASATAGAGSGVTTPEIPNAPGLALTLTAEGEATAKAAGAGQFISYRYQAINATGGKTLVYTQDTWLAYRRWSASAEAMAALNFADYEYGGQKEVQKSHYALSYTSLALFWNHQDVMRDTNGYYTHALSGSGLCRGLSVSTKRLVDLAKGVSQPRLQGGLTRQLLITDAQLRTFLQASEIAALNPQQDGLPASVFIEAGFSLSGQHRIALSEKRRGSPTPVTVYDVKGRFLDPGLKFRELPALEWLRIRFRLSDVDKGKEPLFKLGFPAGLPKINLDASRIRGAGQDALFDYYVHWLNNPQYNSDPGLASWAQELSVPPVVFLHQ